MWLPADVEPGAHPLSADLSARAVAWKRVDLPVLRRAYMNPRGAIGLLRSGVTLWRALRRSRPDIVWIANSACLPGAPIAAAARVHHRVVHVQERWSGSEARVLRLLARWAPTRHRDRSVGRSCDGGSIRRRS